MRTETRDDAFRTHLEPHRRAITLHCYRMLGSLHDAEEVVQDSLLRAWQRLDELRSSGATKAWLYKIATNASLDLLKTRRRRALPHQLAPAADPERPLGAPAHEGLWIEPAPDALLQVPDEPERRPDARMSMHESVSLAFVTALQLLPAKQRAALLLVDVLGWKPGEAADLLKTTETSVNSLLQRARRNLEERRVEPQAPAGPDDAAMVQRFMTAFERGDLDTFTSLLAEDAILSMPPQPEWYAGRDAVRHWYAGFLATVPARFKLLPVRANGLPAAAVYAAPLEGGPYEPVAITLFEARAGRVAQITKFGMPRLFPLFGLPERLPDEGSPRGH